MGCDETGFASIAETTSFLQNFNGLPDHRQAEKVDYPLPEVLLLILLAVLAGAEAFSDIARFGERKIDLLRRFPPYVNGTPSHDHLGWSASSLAERLGDLLMERLEKILQRRAILGLDERLGWHARHKFQVTEPAHLLGVEGDADGIV